MHIPYLIIDFDSTFVTLESLDELANLALAELPQRAETMSNLEYITNLGMEGEIGFAESLQQRLALFRANRRHVEQGIELLNRNITPSFTKNVEYIRKHTDRIYIISGGFTDYIWPVVEPFGIKANHVLANYFTYDASGTITGCDHRCLLAQNDGKIKQVQALQLEGPVWVIGDGWTDYQIRKAGFAEQFLAFTENVERQRVIERADRIIAKFDELTHLIAA